MAQPAHDATQDFQQALSDPTRWVIKPGVPIFKAHQRKDPNTGQLIDVDLPKLYRIAHNITHMERQGVPIRMTLGHTEPGKPEVQQPPVGGYYRNARVQPFGPKGEPAVVVDEWLDPQYAQVRKNFPYRSAEYYDDAEQITGVALLTRDPFLDLGVVAYDKGYTTGGANPPVRYATAPGRQPIFYHFVLGDDPMPAPAYPMQTPGYYPTAPQVQPAQPYGPGFAGPVVPPGYYPPQAAAPMPPAPTPGYLPAQPGFVPPLNVASQPMPYEQPAVPMAYAHPAQRYRNWPGPAYRKHNIGHSHPSGGAVYATETQPSMGGPGGGPGGDPSGGGGIPGGGENPIEMVAQLLTEAVSILTSMSGAPGAGGPPSSPFPGGGGGGGAPPMMASRFARRPARPAFNRPRYYSRDGQPLPPMPPQGAPQIPGQQRTISGLPVGYQMKVDQLQYQLNESNRALKLLYYERDQADTEACIAQIRHLAAQGYQVGEYEVGELKNKPRAERDAYLQHIVTRYQKIGTEMAPPILGDPTPADAGDPAMMNRPATREEMEAALKLTAGSANTGDYHKALHYIRTGQQPGGRGPVVRPGMDPAQFGWPEGGAAPDLPPSFGDPYSHQELQVNGAPY